MKSRVDAMDAQPVLVIVAKAIHQHGLEVVMIGNSAAALQGAPVTTIDIDFLFRKTPANIKKLKAIAKELGGVLLKPYYPSSDLFRLMRDEDTLQLDFMATIHGIRSFEGLRSRAKRIDLGGHSLLVADLADIIKSKRAAGRAKDRAVLEILKKTLHEKEDRKEE
jgi:predicted nucleotidyltransferase